MKMHILLAEDNPVVRRSLAHVLVTAGYRVSEAGTGEEALELFRADRPQLVITDLRMPGLDGLDLLAKVKQESPETPLIIVSGEGGMADAIQGLRLGAWDYLVKPVSPPDLLRHIVDRVLERARLLRENQQHRQALEEAIIARTAELEARHQTLLEQIKEQELLQVQLLQTSKLESVGQLASGVAHEINTPIQFAAANLAFLGDAFTDLQQAISSLAEGEEEGRLTSELFRSLLEKADWPYLEREIPKALHQTEEGLKRVATIVGALKEFSRPAGGDARLVDINHLIEVTLVVAGREWAASSDIHLDLTPDLPAISCRKEMVAQVVLSLLVNAIDAVGDRFGRRAAVREGPGQAEKGEIRISTGLEEKWLRIDIADNGCGIAESIRGRIFDPFFTTKEVGKATGQGLAIAYDVVTNKHGGSLSFASTPGSGTTFTIRLPIG